MLHIYSQSGPHEDAWIAGTPAALTALKAAIDKALTTNAVAAISETTSDGEGYAVLVLPVSADVLDLLPYATPLDVEGNHPFDLLARDAYARAVKPLFEEPVPPDGSP